MSQIRFHVDGVATEWQEEVVRHGAGEHTAVAIVKRLRVDYPHASIAIERRGDVKIPNPVKTYRYKIQDKDNLYYSKLCQETEKDSILAEVKKKFPKAVITEEIK